MTDDNDDATDGPAADGADTAAAPTTDVRAIDIDQEMKNSFMEYSMSVIVSRALPDVRDGLKPVHRRILHGMNSEAMRPDRKHQKCANAVGVVMGRFHPHGDSAIYDALVRLAQDFALRYPMIDPKGNFGSIDFPAAAMRYTESRLNRLAMQMLEGIDEDTVDFVPNYDGQHEEPSVLPARFPNLLVNGQTGIAVGMATNIPPHNLGEVIDAAVHVIDNPDCTVEDLMSIVTAPDFPTGALIVGMRGIQEAYRTGRGSIRMRARAEIQESATGRTSIVVTELPYQVSLQRTAEKIADLVRDGKLEGVSNVVDQSDRDGPRLVIECKRDAVPNVILNNLYKHTQLQDTFGANMVALVNGVPKTLNLKEILAHYVAHQVEVVERRTQFRLGKARDRLHLVEGLLIALGDIDRVIAIIRAAQDAAAARDALITQIGVSEIQANYILDMQLRRLTALEVDKLRQEQEELLTTIARLEEILGDDVVLRAVIKDELGAVRETFTDDRRTEVVPDEGEFDIEDLIADDDLVVTLTRNGYVKSVPADAYRVQGRGGRGVQGGKMREDDVVEHILTTTAHAYLLFFTNYGKVYRIKAHRVPVRDRYAKGIALPQFLPVSGDEHVQAIIDTRDYETARHLVFVTRNGIVKKTRFQEYDSSRSDGLRAVNLRDGDELVSVFTTGGDDDILVVTREGMAIRFAETDARPMGRTAGGVRAISVQPGDAVIAADRAYDDRDVLLVTERGFGKRTPVTDFRPQNRGGKGLIAMKVREERGVLVGARVVEDDDEMLLINTAGVVVKIRAADVSVQGRQATGVKVMSLDDDEAVTALAPAPTVVEDDGADDEGASEDGVDDGTDAPAGDTDGDAGADGDAQSE
jgi:DNA gyrase subunit A